MLDKRRDYSHRWKLLYVILAILLVTFHFQKGATEAISAGTKIIDKKAELAWVVENNGTYDIQYSYFDGNTWLGDILLATDNPVNFVPTIATNTAGETWLVWSSDTGSQYHLYYAVISGDTIMSGPTRIITKLSSNSTPAILFDDNDTPWIAWAGNNGRDDDIYFSTFNGKVWQKPKRAHNDNDKPDVFPQLTFDISGTVNVHWTQLAHGASQKRSATLESGGARLATAADSSVSLMAKSSSAASIEQVASCIPKLPGKVENLDLATLHVNCDKKKKTIQFVGKALRKK